MTFFDWILAPLAFVLFAAYLAILVYFVPDPEMIVVCVIAVVMCGYDFGRSGFRRILITRRDRLER